MADKMWIVDDDISARFPLYTRGNVGEVFPDPVAPFTWSMFGNTGAEMGWRDAWVRTGAFDHEEFGPSDENVIVAVFGSYCYLNVSLARIYAVRAPGLTPEMMDQVLFGAMATAPPYQARPGDDDPAKQARMAETLAWAFSAPELPEIDEEAALTRRLRAARPDLATMDDDELLRHGIGTMDEHFRRLFASHLHTSFVGSVPLGVVTAVCDAIGQGEAAMTLTAGLGGVDSAAPSWAMWELGRMVAASPTLRAAFDAGVDGLGQRLRAAAAASDPSGGTGGADGSSGASRGPAEATDAAAFVAAFDRFLYEFGSRGPNEWEMRSPTWETHPDMALAAIDRMRLTPADDEPQHRWDRRAAEREALAPQLIDALAADPATQGQFAAALNACARFLPARERTKTNVIRLVHEGRMAMREWGRRQVAAGHFDEIEDFGLLRGDELDGFRADPAAFRTVLRERRATMAHLATLEPPFVLDGTTVHFDHWPVRDTRPVVVATAGTVLHGLSGAPGRYTGRARVVHSPTDPSLLEPGDVLVAPITDPSWTPLFVPAGAVVVDVGAPASHAVIVSREIGVPCVVSVTDATRRIPDGATVTVDGSAGTVTVH